MESFPNKGYYHQEGRPRLLQSIDICTGSLLGIKRMTNDESKCFRQNESRRVFTWRGNGPRFRPSCVTKIDGLGGKGIFVCGRIILGSRTPLYVFDAGTLKSQGYRDEILEVYVRFFWMLWVRNAILMTIMRGPTELALLKAFMKERIFLRGADRLTLKVSGSQFF
ncbi:hypothetical protein TNCV_532391 [Trichonephila clavipes]|nr:hypothetical protein TNCV_532391 [Trichonephila clavipes]